MSSSGGTPEAGGASVSRSSKAQAQSGPALSSDSERPAGLATDTEGAADSAQSQAPDAGNLAEDTESPPPAQESAGKPDQESQEPEVRILAPDEDAPQAARQRRWWPFVAPIAAIAVAVSVVIPAGRHQWALSLFRQPTYYTALSFDKAWALPATAAWDAPLSVSFSVANHEGRAVRYRYVLSERAGGSRTATTLKQSARLVPDGGTWTVSTSVRPTCASSTCRVEVSLPGHPETIDFLLNLTFGPPAGG
jgi:hypothetical protein